MPVNKYFVILIDEILIFEVVRDEKNGKRRKIKKNNNTVLRGE
jgi:hypothetical protein